MVDEYKRVIAIVTVALSIITLVSITHYLINSPEIVLGRKIDYLKDQGVPIEHVYYDVGFGCLVVEFRDMEEEYVQPVRDVVGHDQPILFRELDTPRALVGETPATPLELCRAYNKLEESLNLRVVKELDFDEGLFRLKFLDGLTEKEIEVVTELVGDEVPIEFLEWRWKDQIFIGEPSSEVQELEHALTRLQESESEVLKKSISGSCVDERRGMLEIDLYRLEQYSGVIEAIRETIGRDTSALIYLLPYTAHEPKLFTSPSGLIEDYIDTLNLTDVGYDIIHETDDRVIASIYFLVNGEHIQFQRIELEKYNDTWKSRRWSKWGTRSPSRDVEIVGYLIEVREFGDMKYFCSVEPVVENSGEGTAYIYEVEIEVKNSTQKQRQSYHTLYGWFWSGIIKAKNVDSICASRPEDEWITEHGEFVMLPLDPMRGKKYQITILLKDGEGTVLTSKTYTHTFSYIVN